MAFDRVNSIRTIQGTLERAGIPIGALELKSCPQNIKPPSCHHIDRFAAPGTPSETDGMLEFLEYANQWLKKNAAAVPERAKNPAPLFQILTPALVLADVDANPGADTALYQSDEGWITLPDSLDQAASHTLMTQLNDLLGDHPALMREAARILDETAVDWAKLGKILPAYGWKAHKLQFTGDEFAKAHFGLEVQKRPDDPEFFGPFHRILIQSGSPVELPWSDPYLLCLWEAMLVKKGVEVTGPGDGRVFDKAYHYRERKIYDIREEGGLIRFRHFSPTGTVLREKAIPAPAAAPASVERSPDDPSLYFLSVHGAKISVRAHFEESTAPDAIAGNLLKMGHALQILPYSLIRPLLSRHGLEEAIRLTLATEKTAKALEKGTKIQSEYSGLYYPGVNEAVIKMDGPQSAWIKTAYHEVSGHAVDDFLQPGDASSYFTENNLPIQYYYLSKLAPMLTPTDLVNYDRQVREKNDSDFKKRRREEQEKTFQLAAPYEQGLQRQFSSVYAGSGTSIVAQLEKPVEFFAENMTYFYLSLAGYSEELRLEADAEPIYRLIGLDYLMHRYGLASVGGVTREKLYSFESMKSVLGIDLAAQSDFLEQYRENALEEAQRRAMGGREEGISAAPVLGVEMFAGEPAPRVEVGARLQLDHRALEVDPGVFVAFQLGGGLMDPDDPTDVWSAGAMISGAEEAGARLNLRVAGLARDGRFVPEDKDLLFGVSLGGRALIPLWGSAKLSLEPRLSFWPGRDNPWGIGVEIALPIQ